jgi:hypothetical protein
LSNDWANPIWRVGITNDPCTLYSAPRYLIESRRIAVDPEAETKSLRNVTTYKVCRYIGNTFKAIAFVLLLSYGLWFGSDALENGTVPVAALIGFAVPALLFWIGDKLNPSF